MQYSRLPLVGLLFLLFATPSFAQSGYERVGDDPIEFQQAVPRVEPEPLPPPGDPLPEYDESFSVVTDDAKTVETPCPKLLNEFQGYRHHSSATEWIIGDGDQFGMFSLGSPHYQSQGANSGIGVGMQFHWLAGPERIDLPPRVFDLSIGSQKRELLGDFGYDVAVSVMASSDFEGSSREGIRFPSHAVGFLRLGPATELVFGADYLDRGDIKILPVGGLIVMPHPQVRFELVFPRPRMVFQLTDKNRLAISGELGGGTWAIERDTLVDDLVTYRDLRLSVGLERITDEGHVSAFEIAYLFDRRLEYASGFDYAPNDTIMLRWVDSY